MKTLFPAFLAMLCVSSVLQAQGKSNAEIERQLKSLGADRNVTLSFDLNANMSKLMAVSENFSDSESSKANVRAMNFAIGFFYPGQSFAQAPDPILLTFWVLSKKPQFGEDHSMTLFVADESIEIGDSRYVARTRDGMEYLNFHLSREVLTKIASNANARFRLGNAQFRFAIGQQRMLADLLLLSEPATK